jgi:hypothetical protein
MARYRRAIPEISNDFYMKAERQFCAGQITVAQAVGMICTDCDYIAECELTGRDKLEHADVIVRTVWAPKLLQNMRRA